MNNQIREKAARMIELCETGPLYLGLNAETIRLVIKQLLSEVDRLESVLTAVRARRESDNG